MAPLLFTPGPVMVPQAILDELIHQPLHHRSEDFKVISEQVWQQLQRVFRTTSPVVVVAGSAMNAIEAAIQAVHRAGDRVLVLSYGRFSERIVEICTIHGFTPVVYEVPWGETIHHEQLREFLQTQDVFSGAWLVHSETSTGVTVDLRSIAHLIKEHSPKCILGVDAVTSIGIHPVLTDEWELDIVICGVQKGLMCPPGLACISLSPAAQERIRSHSNASSYSMNLLHILDAQKKRVFRFTPPTSLIRALHVALEHIERETLEHVWQRHSHVTHVLQTWLTENGFLLYGVHTSNALTIIEYSESDALQKYLFDRHKIIVAGGQEQLAGRVLRIGTCGATTVDSLQPLLMALHAWQKHQK